LISWAWQRHRREVAATTVSVRSRPGAGVALAVHITGGDENLPTIVGGGVVRVVLATHPGRGRSAFLVEVVELTVLANRSDGDVDSAVVVSALTLDRGVLRSGVLHLGTKRCRTGRRAWRVLRPRKRGSSEHETGYE
jgi:hypothetical protein